MADEPELVVTVRDPPNSLAEDVETRRTADVDCVRESSTDPEDGARSTEPTEPYYVPALSCWIRFQVLLLGPSRSQPVLLSLFSCMFSAHILPSSRTLSRCLRTSLAH